MNKNKVISDLKAQEDLSYEYFDQIVQFFIEDLSILNLLLINKYCPKEVKEQVYNKILPESVAVLLDLAHNTTTLINQSQEDFSLEMIETEYSDDIKKQINLLKGLDSTEIELNLIRKNSNIYEAHFSDPDTSLDIPQILEITKKLSKPYSLNKSAILRTISSSILKV